MYARENTSPSLEKKIFLQFNHSSPEFPSRVLSSGRDPECGVVIGCGPPGRYSSTSQRPGVSKQDIEFERRVGVFFSKHIIFSISRSYRIKEIHHLCHKDLYCVESCLRLAYPTVARAAATRPLARILTSQRGRMGHHYFVLTCTRISCHQHCQISHRIQP